MRKIKLTESQLLYCLKHLNEATNQGAGIKVAAKTDINGKVTQQTLGQQNRELDAQGLNNAQIVVDQDTLSEKYEMYTKKQLKEARKQKLMKESKRVLKRDIDLK